MALVLATKSSTVAKALYDSGLNLEVKPVVLCTDAPKNAQPGIIALELALEQLTAVASKSCLGDPVTVVSVETLIVCQDEILELPKTRDGENSFSRLRGYFVRYADYPVRIYSAVAVKNMQNNKRAGDYTVTEIALHPFTQSEINALSSDESCFESLGGLALNSPNAKTKKLFDKHIARVEGDIKNFTEAPMALIKQLLNEVNYSAARV